MAARVSTSLREARAVVVERQPSVALKAPRRWPDSTPPPSLIARRSLDAVAAEIRIRELSVAQRIAKRSIDIVGSLVGLVLLAPVFLVVALLVRVTSRGPAFFVQKRCGLGGRAFDFYKFRTMVADAEARKAELQHLNEMSGPVFKIARDPRITKVGAILRKTSIDELPQLWNVLKGDMSLVGPRPPLPDEVERYNATQAQRLSVVPGITGLWQVSGRSSLPNFDSWLALDIEYAQKQSVRLDLQILLKTLVVVVTAKGAQ